MSYFSQSPEISSRALNHGDHCSSASVAFAKACREVLAPFTSKKITMYKRRPACLQVLIYSLWATPPCFGCIHNGIDVQKMKGSRIYMHVIYIYTIGCNRSGGTLSLERGSAFSSYVMSSRMRVHIDSKHMHADVRARMQALRYTA